MTELYRRLDEAVLTRVMRACLAPVGIGHLEAGGVVATILVARINLPAITLFPAGLTTILVSHASRRCAWPT